MAHPTSELIHTMQAKEYEQLNFEITFMRGELQTLQEQEKRYEQRKKATLNSGKQMTLLEDLTYKDIQLKIVNLKHQIDVATSVLIKRDALKSQRQRLSKEKSNPQDVELIFQFAQRQERKASIWKKKIGIFQNLIAKIKTAFDDSENSYSELKYTKQRLTTEKNNIPKGLKISTNYQKEKIQNGCFKHMVFSCTVNGKTHKRVQQLKKIENLCKNLIDNPQTEETQTASGKFFLEIAKEDGLIPDQYSLKDLNERQKIKTVRLIKPLIFLGGILEIKQEIQQEWNLAYSNLKFLLNNLEEEIRAEISAVSGDLYNGQYFDPNDTTEKALLGYQFFKEKIDAKTAEPVPENATPTEDAAKIITGLLNI